MWCSIIKIWDIIIGVAPVAFGSVVSDAQVVEAWEEHEDPDDEDRDGTVCPPFANVSCQEQSSYDNEEGPNHEEHNGQSYRLVGDFWWALLELQVNVSIISAGELGIFDFAAGNPSRQICT